MKTVGEEQRTYDEREEEREEDQGENAQTAEDPEKQSPATRPSARGIWLLGLSLLRHGYPTQVFNRQGVTMLPQAPPSGGYFE
jgi:hypothetical protein